MSFKGHLTKSKLVIRYEKFLPAWKEMRVKHGMNEGRWQKEYARSLIEILSFNGFEAEVNDEGDIVDVNFGDDLNLYHVDDFLRDLAPYVEDGSYLRFLTEYDTSDRYEFLDGRLIATSVEV